jgi:hypothetical protein
MSSSSFCSLPLLTIAPHLQLATTHHLPSADAVIVTEVRSLRPYAIKLTQHIDLPPVYICPTCLKPTLFQAGEHWQVCEEQHFAEARGLTFANGASRQVMVLVEKPPSKMGRARNSLRDRAVVRNVVATEPKDRETNDC